MAKYIDADLLRKKIAEQMESLPREVGRGAGTITSKGYGMMQAFQIMRSIIDSLQQEQEKSSDSLEEAANDYCSVYYDWDNEGERKEVVRTFKVGAEWQKVQMMKEVVEGYVTFNTDLEEEGLPCVTVIADEKPMEFYESRGFKLGDKVHIIIVKKE